MTQRKEGPRVHGGQTTQLGTWFHCTRMVLGREFLRGLLVVGAARLHPWTDWFGLAGLTIALKGFVTGELEAGSGDPGLGIAPDPEAVPDYGLLDGVVVRAANWGQRASSGRVQRRLREYEEQGIKRLAAQYGAPLTRRQPQQPRVTVRAPQIRRGRAARMASNQRSRGSRRSAASSSSSDSSGDPPSDPDDPPPARSVWATPFGQTDRLIALDGQRATLRRKGAA
jgi:hypothetical protein